MINVESAAVIVAFAIAYFLVFGGLEDCITAWQNGKLRIEQEKTKQGELALEKSKVDRDKQQLP